MEGTGTHQGSKGVLCVQPELAGVRLVLLNVQTDGGAGRPSARESEDLDKEKEAEAVIRGETRKVQQRR
jgi:hypothetical protein